MGTRRVPDRAHVLCRDRSGAAVMRKDLPIAARTIRNCVKQVDAKALPTVTWASDELKMLHDGTAFHHASYWN